MNETPFLSPVGLKVAKGGIKPLCSNRARRWENQEGAFALWMDRTYSHRKKLYPWKARAGRLWAAPLLLYGSRGRGFTAWRGKFSVKPRRVAGCTISKYAFLAWGLFWTDHFEKQQTQGKPSKQGRSCPFVSEIYTCKGYLHVEGGLLPCTRKRGWL